jgi:hypothetical protein
MERLKLLEEICQPDERHRNRVDVEIATGVVSDTTVQSMHSLIEKITLDNNVPDEVRSHFETAKNLALYSWFVYSFNVVAAMQGYASLEMAVRIKSGDSATPFKLLLDRAFKGRELVSTFGPPIELSVAVPKLRNELAHGSRTLHGQGIAVLQLCADLINELFQRMG